MWLAVALLSVAAGMLGAIGAIPGYQALTAPVADWPRLRLLSAISLVTLGLAMVGHLKDHRPVALAGAALSAALGVAGLFHRAGWLPLPDEGMALASAIMVTTAGIGLLTAAMGRPRSVELGLGISGFVLVVLAGTFALARLTGVVDPMADRVVAGASIQAVAGSFVIGAAFLFRVWSPRLLESARWLPWAVGLSGTIAVLLVWQALVALEISQVAGLTDQAANAEERAIHRDLRATARALRRAAEQRLTGPTAAPAELALELLARDLPGLRAGVWLPVDSLAPPAPALWIHEPAIDSVWRQYLSQHGGLPDSAAYLPLDPWARAFLVIAPGCLAGRCVGAMAGIMSSSGFFERVTSDSTRGYRFEVTYAGRPVDQGDPIPAEERRWLSRILLELGSVRFVLTASPTSSTVTHSRSDLPNLVLFMGLLLSGLSAATIHLGQRARARARDLERGRVAAVLERATDGIWEWDLITEESTRSATLWRYLGYQPEDMPNEAQAWTGLIHPEDQRRVRAMLDAHLTGRAGSYEAEYRIRSQSGEWHWVVDRARVTERLPDGRPHRLLGITADITERRRNDLAREDSERRFRTCFNSAHQLQALLDLEGRVLEANRSALDFGHAELETVCGRPLWESPLWRGTEEATARLRAALEEARAGHTVHHETELADGAGEPALLDFSVTPILDADGQVTQLLAEGRDITLRRRAEEVLREVEALTTMGRLAARVAHEINNPLAGIQNAFLLIKDAVPASHPHHAYVGAIEREIRRIAGVTRQLYETYRPEQADNGATAITSVVGDAIALLEQVNRDSEVRIVSDLRHAPPVVPYPDAVLRQAIYNLVQNAVEASPKGGVVQVIASVERGAFLLRVLDEGPGIAVELRDRVFEPFFTTKAAGVRTGGMGIGLALVRRSVEALGGRVIIADRPSGGTEFTIQLPPAAPVSGELP